MLLESLEKLSLSPMMRFLEHLGLPRKPPLGANDATISWQEAVAHVKRHIDKDIFIGFDIMADPVNNTVNRISVGMPSDSSPLPRLVFEYYFIFLSCLLTQKVIYVLLSIQSCQSHLFGRIIQRIC